MPDNAIANAIIAFEKEFWSGKSLDSLFKRLISIRDSNPFSQILMAAMQDLNITESISMFLKHLNKDQSSSAISPFYFLLPISREFIVFWSNFRNGDFDRFTRYEVP